MDPATTVVTEEVVKGLVAQIKHQFNYLSQYHDNIRNLDSKVDALKSKRQRVEERVERARRNSQEIEGDVNCWLERVEVINKAADEILEDKAKVGNVCWKGWCLNLKLRHKLSRKVVKEALPELDKLLTEAEQFTTVAKPQLALGVVNVPAHSSEIQQANQAVEIQGDEKSENSASCNATRLVPEGIESSAGTRGGLESRLSILRDVMEAVKDNQIRMVRICGMGGVGKTTMAKEVEKMARDQYLFDEIAFVEFNQEPDLKRVQLHIAERLDLELKEDDVKARATRLHSRLNCENKRILVILDNVWRREDLEETGIPLGDEQRCKILLTSRQDDVCKNMATEKEFKIEVLSDPEAMTLFRQSLGNSPCYDQIAELVKACAGLPISIKTIARAVSNKKEVEWKVALRKLKKSALEGEYPTVFNCLKVSYNFLKNEEIKKFFRLCCLFRKGSEVPIEDLARYGIALRLFKDTDKLYEARDEAHRNVEMLLNSNLLLSSDNKGYVKMHDQVWDFAMSTSSTDLFMVNYSDGLKEFPRRDSYEDYTSISLLCSEMDEVLEGQNCQNLELLQLTGNWRNRSLKFQEDFFEGMVGLNVLAFMRINVPLIPKSLQLLATLRTLSLCKCSLGDDVSMIGNLVKLEVLSFAYSNIKELPTELGKLRGLRLLDLTWCKELHIIASGVLSSLISLEELYMRGTPLCRGYKVQVTFTEIASLSKLVVIDIEIPLEVLPMDSLFEKLEKFKISINKYGGAYEYLNEGSDLFPNSLDLICDSSVLLQDGIKFLVQETERMYLKVVGLKTLPDWDFSNLKRLSLVSCNELVYLINSVSKIEFRSLKYLSLQDLPNLVGFCKAWDAVEFLQLEELKLNGLPLLISLHPEMETSASGHSYASSSNPFFNQKGPHPIYRFPNLRSLKVNNCSRLRHLSTPSTFGELQHLEVQSCKSLQAIVAAEGREEEDSAIEGILLPKLNHLRLNDLPNLSTIVPNGYTLRWSSLKKLGVQNCGGKSDLFANTNIIQKGTTDREIALTSLEDLEIWKMNSTELWRNHFPCGFSYKLRAMEMLVCDTLLVLFSPHLIQGFHHLETLSVEYCRSMEVVFDLEELIVGGRDHKVAMLNKLGKIYLHSLGRMTHVWKKVPKNFEGGFHNLTSLRVKNCDSLRYLFSPSIAKCLVKLREVDIRVCEVMEEVVSKRDEEEGQQKAVDIVFFPQLQELVLYLPSLVSIGPAAGACSAFDKLSLEAPNVGSTDKIAMTSLEDMEIRGANSTMELRRDHFSSGFSYGLRKMTVLQCHKLPVIFPPHLVQGFRHLEALYIKRCDSLEVVFDLEELTVGGRHKIVMLNQLAEMRLAVLPRITHVWKKVPKNFEGGFHNLTSLYVSRCDSLRYLFSPLIAKCLVRLRELSIEDCEKMEEVVSEIRGEEVEVQENSVDMINLFPELHEMVLRGLPSLLICLGPAPAPAGANYDFDKQLSFGAPPNNVGTDHDQGNASSSTSTRILNEKIALTSLEDMEIRGANSSMELWRDHFANGLSYGLKKMTVKYCDKLPVIFPPHLVQGFPHLEALDIEKCDSLEVVFDLEELTVGGRHKIAMLNQLNEMTLDRLPRMTHVWKKVPKNFEGRFHNLTSLYVSRCDSLRYLFSPLIAKCLVRLRKLSIEFCEKMEEVVSEIREEEGEVQENSVDMINLFPELQELVLLWLPSLLIWLGPAPAGANYDFDKQLSFGAPPNNVGTDHDQGNASSSTYTRILNEKSSNPPSLALVGMGRCQFPAWSLHNLTHLKVHGCDKLLYLFPPHMVVRLPVLQSLSIKSCKSLIYLLCSSTATSLVQLRDLTIIECEMMEVIVKDEDEVEADRMGKLIVFSSLTSIVLRTLSNLKGFCLKVLCFEWPLLTSVEIKLCWKMGVFTSGHSNTPILDNVFINSDEHSLEGDLNTTLMSLQQKDNLALKDKGILTINGFLIAGDHLVAQCPTWSWDYSWRNDSDLPRYKQFLITKNVPCLKSAFSKVVVEDKIEGDECSGDDKNIPRTWSYDFSITFDKPNKSPRLWLRGYDDESKLTLPLERVLQNIVEYHPRELVAIEKHPYLDKNHLSLYLHLQPNFMKDIYDHCALQGIQPNVENYLQILLEAYASVVSTIK